MFWGWNQGILHYLIFFKRYISNQNLISQGLGYKMNVDRDWLNSFCCSSISASDVIIYGRKSWSSFVIKRATYFTLIFLRGYITRQWRISYTRFWILTLTSWRTLWLKKYFKKYLDICKNNLLKWILNIKSSIWILDFKYETEIYDSVNTSPGAPRRPRFYSNQNSETIMWQSIIGPRGPRINSNVPLFN